MRNEGATRNARAPQHAGAHRPPDRCGGPSKRRGGGASHETGEHAKETKPHQARRRAATQNGAQKHRAGRRPHPPTQRQHPSQTCTSRTRGRHRHQWTRGRESREVSGRHPAGNMALDGGAGARSACHQDRNLFHATNPVLTRLPPAPAGLAIEVSFPPLLTAQDKTSRRPSTIPRRFDRAQTSQRAGKAVTPAKSRCCRPTPQRAPRSSPCRHA